MGRTFSGRLLLCVLGLAIATSAAARAEGPSSLALKWEYNVLTKEQVLRLGNDNLATGLNKLGGDGWELTAVDGSYIFKRPRDDRSVGELKRRLQIDEVEVEKWRDRVAFSERMVKKGYMTAAQAQSERARLAEVETMLERTRKDLDAASPAPKPAEKKAQ